MGQVLGVRCHVSRVTCHVPRVICNMSLTPLPQTLPLLTRHYVQQDAADYLDLDPSTMSRKDRAPILDHFLAKIPNSDTIVLP